MVWCWVKHVWALGCPSATCTYFIFFIFRHVSFPFLQRRASSTLQNTSFFFYLFTELIGHFQFLFCPFFECIWSFAFPFSLFSYFVRRTDSVYNSTRAMRAVEVCFFLHLNLCRRVLCEFFLLLTFSSTLKHFFPLFLNPPERAGLMSAACKWSSFSLFPPLFIHFYCIQCVLKRKKRRKTDVIASLCELRTTQ